MRAIATVAVFLGLMLSGVLSFAHAIEPPETALKPTDLPSASGSEWQPVKSNVRLGISTWSRREDDKTWRSFKVEARLKSSMQQLEQVLFDFDNYNRWYWQVMDSRLLKTVSPTEFYLYLVHNAPLQLPDRDVILRVRIEPMTGNQSYARVRFSAVPDYLPTKPPLVRMVAEDFTMLLVPDGDDILLKAEGVIDPGGSEPVWAANYVQRSAPYTIAANLSRVSRQADATAALRSPYRLSQLP